MLAQQFGEALTLAKFFCRYFFGWLAELPDGPELSDAL
jgi:hypothetical protein